MGKRAINPDTAAMLAYFDSNPAYRRDWNQTNKKVWAIAHVDSKPGEFRSYVGRNGVLYSGCSPAKMSVDTVMREIYIRGGNEILNKELNA